ncbi:MAG: SRPBCC family protein [Myxococcales bacterium FL481]|nr:MAG: SRPBCC family protein [Myxococcales bacterium FL481]
MTPAPRQGQWTITAHASLSEIWAVISDSANLPKWCTFMVKETTGGQERLGARRSCTLDTGGRQGRVHERCIEYEPPRRIMWTMDDDTLGMTNMLDGLAFGFELKPLDAKRTEIVFEQYWKPRTLAAKILAPLVLRRQMSRTNTRLLAHLRDFVDHKLV